MDRKRWIPSLLLNLIVFSLVSFGFVGLDVESCQHLSMLETRQGSESKHCSLEKEDILRWTN